MKEKYFYSVFEESRSSQELGAYITYGIKAAGADGHGACLDTVSDISLSGAGVGALTQPCNELQLSPVHLRDIVEDFLAR